MKKFLVLFSIIIFSCNSPNSSDSGVDLNIREVNPVISSFATPYSGELNKMVFDENHFLITSMGVNSGLFKYHKASGIWENLIEDDTEHVLRIDENTLFTAGHSVINISNDNGETWVQSENSVTGGDFTHFSGQVSDLSIGLNNSIIAVLDVSRTNNTISMVRSEDGIKNWVNISPPTPLKKVLKKDNVLYAIGGSGVYTSSNNGDSWTKQNQLGNGWHSIFLDSSENIWVINEKEIYKWDGNIWEKMPKVFGIRNIGPAVIDENDQIYFISGSAAFRYYANDGHIERITELEEPVHLKNIQASDGFVYIATLEDGLHRVSASSTNEAAELFGVPIYTDKFVKDAEGNLFLESINVFNDSHNGLYSYRKGENFWDKISEINKVIVTPEDGLVQLLFNSEYRYSNDLGKNWIEGELKNEKGEDFFVSSLWIGLNNKLRILAYDRENHSQRSLKQFESGSWSTLAEWNQVEEPASTIETQQHIFFTSYQGLFRMDRQTLDEPELVLSGVGFDRLYKDKNKNIYALTERGIEKGDESGEEFEIILRNTPEEFYRIIFLDSQNRVWVKVTSVNQNDNSYDGSYILVVNPELTEAIRLDVDLWESEFSPQTYIVETNSGEFITTTRKNGLQKFRL